MAGTDLSSLLQDRGDDLDRWARTINPQFVRVLRTIDFDRTWERAEGAYLWDSKGDRYLDMLGGFGMLNVGRNNRRVRDTLIEALELDLPGAVQLGATALPGLLAEALLARVPDRLERVQFTSSGTEAIEAVLKLGRAATKRSRVISADHGFHGLTLGSLSANGNPEFTARFGPLLPGFDQVPFGDLDALELELRREDVAVFLVEPVQGKGVNLPPDGYLQGAQALCRRYGTLFCVDEIQTGFGRTGKLFAFEHWGLEPDLVPVAKSLSGGYVPVGALLMSRAVHEAVYDSMQNAVAHGSTFAPNELGMVAGLATLQELDDERLVEHSARLGNEAARVDAAARRRVRRRAGGARARPHVGDRVRGAGIAEALVEDDRADAARPLRATGRRPALLALPHPESGRGPQDRSPEGAAPARHQRRGHRVLRRVPRVVDQESAAHAERTHALRVDRGRYSLNLLALAELAELGTRCDAGGRPAVRRRDDPIGSLARGLVAVLGLDLDHDLVHRRLDVVAELVSPLCDHGEGGDVGAQSAGEVVDLGRCCVAAGVHAEVHPHLEGGRGMRADAECDFGLHGDVHTRLPTGGCGI